ncbi:MAG: VCBS repeat-containing protein [Candidatus Hydrogenedens sp.]|jgi:hypothetical protein|nr:VCBS repeat-containing protein [Candidatus Hydrogenedens sp.]
MNVLLFISLLTLQIAEPRLFTLESPANVWDVATAKMSQTDQQDILLLVNDEQAWPSCKELLLYAPDTEGAYPSQPTHRLALPEETGALFLAEVDGKEPVEIVAVHGSGAKIYHFTGHGFSLLKTLEFQSLYPTGSREPSFVKAGALDLRGSGVDEWLIPLPGGFQIRNSQEEFAFIPCDLVSEMRSGESIFIVHRFPDIHAFAHPETKTRALAFLSDEFADFAWGDDWEKRKRIPLPMKLEEKWDASARMKDITGDGFPDLVITQTRGTSQMYAETHVYLAKEPFVYDDTPDAIFSAKGAVSSPVLLDVNGDGFQDLIFIRIPFGVKNLVSFFVRNKISIKAGVHLFDGQRFHSKADYSTQMTMDAPEGRARVAYTFGDFNGDGLVDVIYGSGKNTLALYLGDSKAFLSSRPWKKFAVPAFGTARPYDLDGQGGKDLILFRPGTDLGKRVEVFLFQ